MGVFASTTDGAVEVDSNIGTVDELKAEIATEVPKPRGTGKAAPVVEPPVKTAKVNPADSDEIHAGEDDDEQAAVVKPTQAAQQPKKKKSLQARIDDIRADLGTTQRERDASRAEVARLQGELDAKNGKGAKKGEHGGVAFTAERFPKYVDYLKDNPDADVDDWVEARDGWKDAKAAAAGEIRREVETGRMAQSERFAPLAKTYYDRIKPTLDADPKFYEKVDRRLTETPALSALPPGQKPTFGNFLVEQVIKSSVPAELMIHLSEEGTIRRLVTLPPDEIIREITTFELAHRPSSADTGPEGDEQDDDEESNEPPARVPAPRSQASPPVKPVRGSSQQSTGKEPDDDDSDDAWAAANAKKERERLRKQRLGA